jgi:hypothetical protein
MDTTSSPVQWICATVMIVAVLGGMFALAWHGTVSSTELVTVVTTIIAIAGGAFAVHAGVNSGAKAAKNTTT